MGIPVLAGVDYGRVLNRAEELGDVILWDGGNNDFPFFRPNFAVVVADARRPGHEVGSFPGEVNLRIADIVIITKVSDAGPDRVKAVEDNVRRNNRRAAIAKADLEVSIERPDAVNGRRALVVEDAPTVTHGGLPYGAGYIAAQKYGARIVDPRPFAVGSIRELYAKYGHMGPVLPSLGYTDRQKRDLEETIARADVDVVIIGTPARIEEVIKITKPVVRVKWDLKILDGPSIKEIVDMFLEKINQF